MNRTQNALLPSGWRPKEAADRVLEGLVNLCPPQVKGAHDSDFLILDGKAYVVYMANDVRPGEAPHWPDIYDVLSVVDVTSGEVEQTTTFAASKMVYENATLPEGACFVPRIVQKDARTLRCYFASESPGARQSQTWFTDYDLGRGALGRTVHPARIETSYGVFPMQPQHFYCHATAKGFTGQPKDYGLYPIDSFKRFDGRVYAVLNNFPGGQNALALLNDALDRFTIIGDYFMPNDVMLTESAVNRMPDGTWCAISRQEHGDRNYMFTTSRDGVVWTQHETRDFVRNGDNSKPTFDRFGDVYYLGWQEATRVKGVHRSIFNIDVSRDGVSWERKYRFETEKSFQYPVFREYAGGIYLTVTQGHVSDSRKERIMFGRLE